MRIPIPSTLDALLVALGLRKALRPVVLDTPASAVLELVRAL